MAEGEALTAGAALTAAPRFTRIQIVANERSGSVEQGAAAAAERLARDLGFEAHGRALGPTDLMGQLKAAVDAKPDLLVVIAGDGTANAAASLCGPDGPLLAPLPGGTMNMLPHALYGRRTWRAALEAILTHGEVKMVGGGEVNGRPFHVAAILGNPALWAPAREALRGGRLLEAMQRALYAWRRCFHRKLRYALDGGPKHKAEALALMCPLISRALPHDAEALEAVGIDPPGMGAVLRLGLHALLSPLAGPILGGDWRNDPYVTPGQCREGFAFSRRHVHAILDGELVRLPKYVAIRFKPQSFRALVPVPDPHDRAPNPTHA